MQWDAWGGFGFTHGLVAVGTNNEGCSCALSCCRRSWSRRPTAVVIAPSSYQIASVCIFVSICCRYFLSSTCASSQFHLRPPRRLDCIFGYACADHLLRATHCPCNSTARTQRFNFVFSIMNSEDSCLDLSCFFALLCCCSGLTLAVGLT